MSARAGVVELKARALLFDLDGVLVDSTASVERHWRNWAHRHQLDADALIAVVHGRRALDTIRERAPHLDAESELASLVAAEANDTSGVVAMPGAAQLLESLPRRRWAIVTSGVREVALARLKAAALPVPAVLITADRVSRGKPDPEGYLAAAAELRERPAHCIVVEDAPAGIDAARRGGFRCIALLTTHRAEEVAGATAIARDTAALSVRTSQGMSPSLTVSVSTALQ